MKELKPGQESNPRTLSQFMAAESVRNPKALWESEEEYKQRLYLLAHSAFERFMREQRWLVSKTGQANANFGLRPATQPELHTVPVRIELLDRKQVRLWKAQAKYQRD